MEKISIKKIKEVRESLELSHLVIYGVDEDGVKHIATHGKTIKDAKEAAEFGNTMRGKLSWPESTRDLVPLKRVCENCGKWRRYNSTLDRTKSYENGKCFHEPKVVERNDSDIACRYFEPNC